MRDVRIQMRIVRIQMRTARLLHTLCSTFPKVNVAFKKRFLERFYQQSQCMYVYYFQKRDVRILFGSKSKQLAYFIRYVVLFQK
jgi:hypothetical protein